MALWLDGDGIADFWCARQGKKHHLFFLRQPRHGAPPTSIGHAVSADLAAWEFLPDVLSTRDEPGFDDLSLGGGSIMRCRGQWALYYSARSHAEPGVEKIGRIVSGDLHFWRREPAGPLLTAYDRFYETSSGSMAWADPFVFRADDLSFHAFIAARLGEADDACAATVAHAVSEHGREWLVLPPAASAGMFRALHSLQMARIGGAPYLLFGAGVAEVSPCYLPPGEPARGGVFACPGASATGPFRMGECQSLTADEAGTYRAGRVVQRPGGGPALLLLRADGVIEDPRPIRRSGAGLLEID
jgi:hypothetical protein